MRFELNIAAGAVGSRLILADVFDGLRSLPAESVHCVVTSPPYWSLRDYGVSGQFGLEPSFADYLHNMAAVFAEVWRVLRPDGTLWLNMGDAYAAGGFPPIGFKRKDLIGQPWRLAFRLQADGWYLRRDIIWEKPNPMPESTRDRPTTAHEYVFLMTKAEHYFYDADAIREPVTSGETLQTRNKRSVWRVVPAPFPGHFATFPPKLIEPMILAGTSAAGCCSACGSQHKRQIKLSGGTGKSWHDHEDDLVRGQRIETLSKTYKRETTGWSPGCQCSAGVVPAVVLDPFGGSGTTALVANRLGRSAILIDLNAKYTAIQLRRLVENR
jgi:site-specific DNA-methyltransferase (adenine-specific)